MRKGEEEGRKKGKSDVRRRRVEGREGEEKKIKKEKEN